MVEGPRRVRFNFKTTQNRELPLIVGGLPVLPKHFFDGRDFTKPLTDAPIGSGPYRITNFELGRSVTYHAAIQTGGQRTCRPAAAPIISIRVRYEYFRDSTVAMEAFKAGKVDLRSENIAKNWATAYDFPAVQNGAVIKREYTARIAHRHSGLRDEHAPPDLRRSSGPAGRHLGFRFRMDQQESVLFRVQTNLELFQQYRPRRDRPAVARGTEAAGAVSRTACRTGC